MQSFGRAQDNRQERTPSHWYLTTRPSTCKLHRNWQRCRATPTCQILPTEENSIDVEKRRHIGRTRSCFALVCKKLPHEHLGPQHTCAGALENVHRPVKHQREGDESHLGCIRDLFPSRCMLVKGPQLGRRGRCARRASHQRGRTAREILQVLGTCLKSGTSQDSKCLQVTDVTQWQHCHDDLQQSQRNRRGGKGRRRR